MKLKGLSKFENVWPRNPTQTGLLRFMRLPGGDMKTAFGDAMKNFESSRGQFDFFKAVKNPFAGEVPNDGHI